MAVKESGDRMIEEWQMPKRATCRSAGYDFVSPEGILLEPGKWTTIDTGVRLADMYGEHPPSVDDWFMLLAPRSSLGFKYGLRFRNTVGIIDQDYPDTIRACVTVDEQYTLKKGERFMQGIVMPRMTFAEEIRPTKERTGGLGSTGE